MVRVVRVLGVSSTWGFAFGSLREKAGEMKRFGFWLFAQLFAALAISSPVAAVHLPNASIQITYDNVDVIVLVDESGSLSENDVAAERNAIIEMVSLPTILGKGIKIGVYPFSSGSDSPREIKDCNLRPIDDGGDDYLRNCTKSIKRQQNGNTDFASAFRFAAEKFDQVDDGTERSHTIILLTDGKYRPVTDRKPNPEEEQALTDSLNLLKQSKIAIWSLGFGDADLEALQTYSDAASERDKHCDSAPTAYPAEIKNLSLQLRQVVAEVTCRTVTPPDTEIPSKRFIHPLIDTVYVTVDSIDGITPELYAPNGDPLCASDWQNVGSTFTCLVKEDGSHSGKWELRATQGSQVIWEYGGTVQIQFDQCPKPQSVSITRFDGNPIDYSAAQLWPNVIVRTENSNSISPMDEEKLLVNAPAIKLGVKTSGDDTETFFELQSKNESDGLPLLNSRPVSCKNLEPQSAVTTVPPPPPPSCKELGNCPPPKWPYFLLLFVIAGGVFAAMRWLKSKQFPAGTVIKQESSVARGVWIDLPGGEIGGKRRVSLVVQSSGVINVEPYGAGAQYVVSPLGDQVKIVFSPDPESADDSLNDIRVEPYGMSIRFSGFVLRVEKPEEDEEETD